MIWLLACTSGEPEDSHGPRHEDSHEAEPAVEPVTYTVTVTLDGESAQDVLVTLAPGFERLHTDAQGQVTFAGPGDEDVYAIAAHGEARTGVLQMRPEGELERTLELVRFDTSDNAAYVFDDPGSPTQNESTAQCAHCHVTTNEDWYGSVHRQAASNPVVQGVYASVDAVDGCADCHAPGMGGALGGQRLDEAEGIALESGVHCDVCHKVESVDLDAPPGVAGRLVILRPSEPSTGPGMGDWLPLTFGPYADVPNPRMGAVPREHFQSSEFCAGCHELDQPTAVDTERWPDGELPIQSTFSEWVDGPLNPSGTCQGCHMPPDADAGNLADIQLLTNVPEGVAAGWWRPPGSMRRHTWPGPRSQDTDMLGLAAALFVETEQQGSTLTVRVTSKNAGPGHAIPTGEPLRSILLTVDVDCGVPVGGSAVPDFGGALAVKAADEDWEQWPAEPGQVIRVVRVEGWVDYIGHGPFGDGRFDAQAKGLPDWQVVGQSTVLSVDPLVLDRPLPEGDLALLGDATWLAGAPGFGFARVTVDAQGQRMVPHHLAVDVASDNRLLPQQSWTSTHVFDVGACESEPVASARLTHRALPLDLADELAVPARDTEMSRW